MSTAIIPSRNHNDIFLNESININKELYINDYFVNNEYYKEFMNYNTNSIDTIFIKSRLLISKFYYILVEKVLKETNYQIINLVYLQKEQLYTLIDLVFKLNSSSNMFLSILDYLKTLKKTQLIYLKQNINFKRIQEIPYNKLTRSSDKIYDIYNIKDMNLSIYNYMYYENDLINNINLSSNPKTKKDYIKRFYLDNNSYSTKEKIVDYIKYCFEELYLDILNNDTPEHSIEIDSVLFFNIIYILSQNNDWSYKFKWFLYYLQYDKLIKLDK